MTQVELPLSIRGLGWSGAALEIFNSVEMTKKLKGQVEEVDSEVSNEQGNIKCDGITNCSTV